MKQKLPRKWPIIARAAVLQRGALLVPLCRLLLRQRGRCRGSSCSCSKSLRRPGGAWGVFWGFLNTLSPPKLCSWSLGFHWQGPWGSLSISRWRMAGISLETSTGKTLAHCKSPSHCLHSKHIWGHCHGKGIAGGRSSSPRDRLSSAPLIHTHLWSAWPKCVLTEQCSQAVLWVLLPQLRTGTHWLCSP